MQSRSIFKYREDIRPVTLILTGVCLSLLPFAFATWVVWPLCLLGIALRVLVPIHQHYHSHNSTFQTGFLNEIYDVILSIGGGNLTALWKVHHGLGHHVDYLDQHKDLEGNLRFGVNIPCRRLVFTVLGDSLSLYDSFMLLRKFPRKVGQTLRRRICIQLLIQVAILAVLLSLNAGLAAGIFFVPNLFLRWAIFWFSYGQHDELPMTNIYDSSTTRFRLNRILLNVGLHTAHHESPGAHWSKLEQRTQEILPLIDPACFAKAPFRRTRA